MQRLIARLMHFPELVPSLQKDVCSVTVGSSHRGSHLDCTWRYSFPPQPPLLTHTHACLHISISTFTRICISSSIVCIGKVFGGSQRPQVAAAAQRNGERLLNLCRVCSHSPTPLPQGHPLNPAHSEHCFVGARLEECLLRRLDNTNELRLCLLDCCALQCWVVCEAWRLAAWRIYAMPRRAAWTLPVSIVSSAQLSHPSPTSNPRPVPYSITIQFKFSSET